MAENAKTKRNVPGYCGFVPQLKSENVFGNTYGATTQQQREGKIHGGFDVQGAERFRSVTQGVYTEQMQSKVHGYQQDPNAQGQLPMNFEQAKKAAKTRRDQQFDANKQRFYGNDGWDQSAVTQSANNFWG